MAMNLLIQTVLCKRVLDIVNAPCIFQNILQMPIVFSLIKIEKHTIDKCYLQGIKFLYAIVDSLLVDKSCEKSRTRSIKEVNI